ncbi:hypothetical protein D3C72_1224220 [compost metagenome]
MGNRCGLFQSGGALGQLHAQPRVEPHLRRRAGAPSGQVQGRRAGPRSGLCAQPPQPHGLPAAVLPAVRPWHRAAAHRRRHQPEPAGGRHPAAQGRCVLHPPLDPWQRAVLGGAQRVRGAAGRRRLLHRILRRGWALAYRPPAAAQGRHDLDDPARVPAPAAQAGAVPAHLHRLREADGGRQLPG